MQSRNAIALLFYIVWGLLAPTLHAEFPPETFPDEDSLSPNPPADEDYLAPKKRRRVEPPKKTARPRPSVMKEPLEEEEEDTEALPASPARPRRFLFQALTGLSALSSSNAANQSNITTAALGDHFAMAADIDLRMGKYLGVEVEGFYAFTPANELDLGGGDVITQQLKELGVLGSLRVETALNYGSSSWRPRVFFGYGLGTLGQEITSDIGPGGYALSSNGLHWGIGLEAEFASGFRLLGDFASGLGTSGALTLAGATGSGTTNLSNASYSRLRFGASLLLFGRISLGASLIIRSFQSNAPTQTGLYLGASDRLLQMLGTVGFQL
jgi:hypothetical protein